MSRVFWLAVPLLLLSLCAVVVAAEIPQEETLPADVQALLEGYVTAAYPFSEVQVAATGRARRPWNFESEMSRVAYVDSFHVHADAGPTPTLRTSLSLLPYPPQQVWCARLNLEPAQPVPAFVYVALHLDLYNADLVVHKAAGDSQAELLRQLRVLDCNLDLSGAEQ
jgi:hypothetical protein